MGSGRCRIPNSNSLLENIQLVPNLFRLKSILICYNNVQGGTGIYEDRF